MTWLYVLAFVLGCTVGGTLTAWLLLVAHLLGVQKRKGQQ